jgi:hypothetical protein
LKFVCARIWQRINFKNANQIASNVVRVSITCSGALAGPGLAGVLGLLVLWGGRRGGRRRRGSG